MTQAPSASVLSLKSLPQRKPTRHQLAPNSAQLAAIAADFDLSALRKVRFDVVLTPGPGADWTLKGKLAATVVQPCRVTLDPVTTRIQEDVLRRYTDRFDEVTESEAEMDADDTLDPLPETLDLEAVMLEALALAIPAFPRVPEADSLELRAAPPGVDPLSDEAVKPFAGLADLKAQMDLDPGESDD